MERPAAGSDRVHGSGSFSGACIPALADHYADKVARLLALAGSALSSKELARFRTTFARQLQDGYRQTPYARFVVSYEALGQGSQRPRVTVAISPVSYEDECREWMAGPGGDEPFGKNADAKVLALAEELRSGSRVLDVGAGTGRNALALARRGPWVDALEPTAMLAQVLRAAAANEAEGLCVIERDLFAPGTSFEAERYALIVLSEVVTHFTLAEFRRALSKLCPALEPGGLLLFNTFLWNGPFPPDELARQAAKTLWSTFLTSVELDACLEANRLDLVSDEDAAAYEREHLPSAEWPPTRWYESWAAGHNVFDAAHGPAPMQLRWLVCRRR